MVTKTADQELPFSRRDLEAALGEARAEQARKFVRELYGAVAEEAEAAVRKARFESWKRETTAQQQDAIDHAGDWLAEHNRRQRLRRQLEDAARRIWGGQRGDDDDEKADQVTA